MTLKEIESTEKAFDRYVKELWKFFELEKRNFAKGNYQALDRHIELLEKTYLPAFLNMCDLAKKNIRK